MKNITSLRNHLFDALNRLAEADEVQLEIEINKASSIVQVAETIIRTCEVENQFIAITKGIGSGFIPLIGKIDGDAPIQIEDKKEIFDTDSKRNWIMDENTNETEIDNTEIESNE